MTEALDAALQTADAQFGRVDRGSFEQFLASKLSDTPVEARADWIRAWRLPDLILVYCASNGLPAAISMIEALVQQHCSRGLRPGRTDLDDVVQRVLVHLLVPDEGRSPRLLGYRGVAALSSFLRVLCTRMAVSMARKRQLNDSSLSSSYPDAALGDPDIDVMRARFRAVFVVAFREALQRLSPKKKLLLKMNLQQGVPVAAMAVMHNVHRVTVSRWLAEAKEELFAATRERLRAAVPLSDTEFQSVARLMRSDIELSLSHVSEEDWGRTE